MATERTRSVRKASGGRYKPYRKSRQFAKVNQPILTRLGEYKSKQLRGTGASKKVKIIAATTISVADPKTKSVKVATIKTVKENAANINYIIRNILNKGAIVDTSLGKVKITSRPGQNGSLSGVLIQ